MTAQAHNRFAFCAVVVEFAVNGNQALRSSSQVFTCDKSFEILTRRGHAHSKLKCQRNVQFHVLSVFLPISSRDRDFSWLPS